MPSNPTPPPTYPQTRLIERPVGASLSIVAVGSRSENTNLVCITTAMHERNAFHSLPGHTDENLSDAFRKCWVASTADNNLTLHGFRRFKTTQLLNLRLLENEIADIDHRIYQAGLSLDLSPSSADRLGLAHSKRDANVPKINDVITRELILKLRERVKQYSMYCSH